MLKKAVQYRSRMQEKKPERAENALIQLEK